MSSLDFTHFIAVYCGDTTDFTE